MFAAKHDAILVSSREPRLTRVLVAEDDNEMRELVAGALRERGFVVDTVPDGTHLLAKADVGLSGEPFDLIVSDIRMPGCSGLVFLEKLRKAGRMTPVVLMTAFGDEETRERVISLGGFLLEKPFDIHRLEATVRRVLSTPRRS